MNAPVDRLEAQLREMRAELRAAQQVTHKRAVNWRADAHNRAAVDNACGAAAAESAAALLAGVGASGLFAVAVPTALDPVQLLGVGLVAAGTVAAVVAGISFRAALREERAQFWELVTPSADPAEVATELNIPEPAPPPVQHAPPDNGRVMVARIHAPNGYESVLVDRKVLELFVIGANGYEANLAKRLAQPLPDFSRSSWGVRAETYTILTEHGAGRGWWRRDGRRWRFTARGLAHLYSVLGWQHRTPPQLIEAIDNEPFLSGGTGTGTDNTPGTLAGGDVIDAELEDYT